MLFSYEYQTGPHEDTRGELSVVEKTVRPLKLILILLLVLVIIIAMMMSDSGSESEEKTATKEYYSTVSNEALIDEAFRLWAFLVAILSKRAATNANAHNRAVMLLEMLTGIVRKVYREPNAAVCYPNLTTLGPINVDTDRISLSDIETKFPEVAWGGCFRPNCTSLHKVAIIVPYRDREDNLAVFLKNIHPFLMSQNIEYGIFIVEQEGISPFNRGKLFNVGYVEIRKLGFECFVFHDVDLLPMDSRNLYTCPRIPRHHAVQIDKFKFKLPYQWYFGGVTALTAEQFASVNGFSNRYWGWGAEDDDFGIRLAVRKYPIGRYKPPLNRYYMLNHEQGKPNKKRFNILHKAAVLYHKDGLNNLQYYRVTVTQYHLYTRIAAIIDADFDGLSMRRSAPPTTEVDSAHRYIKKLFSDLDGS